jgi:hypothetical protein
MKLLMVMLLMACPALFEQSALAQGRGGGRSGGVVRGPVRVAPGPVARPLGPVIVPYPVYGGYYANPYYSGYATAPVPVDPNSYYYDPSQGYQLQGQGYPPPSPSVLVNPNYVPDTANPVLRDYSNVPVPEAVPQQGADPQTGSPQVFFLIAMKDHAIYPAIAYWVEDSTLNYISQQGVRNSVPLDQVDRAFSTQLNKERNIDFALPPPK